MKRMECWKALGLGLITQPLSSSSSSVSLPLPKRGDVQKDDVSGLERRSSFKRIYVESKSDNPFSPVKTKTLNKKHTNIH